LADIAYLLRRIGYRIGAKNISIEAYLVDAPVFQQVASARYPVLQANAFAAMRDRAFSTGTGVSFQDGLRLADGRASCTQRYHELAFAG